MKIVLKWEVNSRLKLTEWRVRETSHFPVEESKARAGKQYWYACYYVTGSDLPLYYSLAVTYLKVPNGGMNGAPLIR